jgi:hypothetical protein
MNKGQKVALKHAANAIGGTRNGVIVVLGASESIALGNTKDSKGREYASVYLAKRAGFDPASQFSAQQNVVSRFGLTSEQVEKLDKVAASTHNIMQRADRVSRFLRRVAENPSYIGFPSRSTNGAVAATL